jgi:hypothetical protein
MDEAAGFIAYRCTHQYLMYMAENASTTPRR